MNRKLIVNFSLSLGMLGVCLWLVWPDPEQRVRIALVFTSLDAGAAGPYLAGGVLALIMCHVFRALRWNHLLEPLDVRIPAAPLLAISSVGFMAILALPARLGEFVRPALLRSRGHLSASAALGTVFVERVVDGLIISLLLVVLFALRADATAPDWMLPTGFAALGVFLLALAILVVAILRPERTVGTILRLSLLPRLSPAVARVLEAKALDGIRGFRSIASGPPFLRFVGWSLVYWTANGISFWLLALGLGLDLSLTGAFATMALIGVGISLPNAPALVGQFQGFAILGLSLYLGMDTARAEGLAFAIFVHALHVTWYMGAGALALATPYVSLSEVVAARKVDDDVDDDRLAPAP